MTDIGKLVAAQAREVAKAKDLHTGVELPVPARYPRYRVTEYNVRQNGKTGFGIIRISPYGDVTHLHMPYATRIAATAVVETLNQWAGAESA